MLIIKSAGSTPTEKVLAHFGELSFLSLWSYPNPYTDEGKKNDGDGKELCDLLVLFGNHVLIFSDKSIEYKDTGRLEIDWGRWYKKAIHKSASQIYGAENWIKTYPDRIFLDSKCKNKFPLQFPNANNLIIHRIIVTPLSGESMKNLIGGSGTLSINSNVKDNEHYDNPFCVGHINSQKGYIHILNETSLEILMRELNTVNDFIEYLTKKEELMLSNQLVHVAGEEELLAIYQETIDENNHHAFIFEDTNIVISEGFWENHIKRPEYLLRHEADKISFLWDRLIDRVTYFLIREELISPHGQEPLAIEIALRIMASEKRVYRRALSEALFEAARITKPDDILRRVAYDQNDGSKAYVFLIMNKPENLSYEQYREVRQLHLNDYVIGLRSKYRQLKKIVGIAREPVSINGCSEDILYFDCEDWSAEDQSEAEILCKVRGFLKSDNIKERLVHHDEYPNIEKFIQRKQQ